MSDLNGHSGTVVWFTGRPASGKSTLAERVAGLLRQARRQTVVLDSDTLRPAIAPDLGYAPRDRTEFYQRLAALAALLAHDGVTVLVPATAPERKHRKAARALAPAFLEVYVDTPHDLCARRDLKGLYERAAAGTASFVPGVGVPYEAPEAPDVVAHGGQDGEAVERILTALEP